MRKSLTILLTTFVITLLCSSCSTTTTIIQNKNYYSFTDDLGREVILQNKPQNVIAAMGSYGELWQLAGGDLIGVTEDAISERGMQLADDVKIIGTVKELNHELIIEANPDFVLLTTDVASHKDLGETLEQVNIPHAFFKVDTFEDYLNMLKICTDINNTPRNYNTYGTELENQINDSIEKASTQEQPKVLLIRTMATKAKALKDDHMVGYMLKDLNTNNIAVQHTSLLEDLSMETIIMEDPDFIFVITMGDVTKALNTLETTVLSNPAWNQLSAVKNDQFFILPKDLFQYKPNANWAKSYNYLERILYENYKPKNE